MPQNCCVKSRVSLTLCPPLPYRPLPPLLAYGYLHYTLAFVSSRYT